MHGCIFDLDGTLIDSLDDIANAVNQMLRERAHPPRNRAAVRGYIGHGARALIERSLPPSSLDVEEALLHFRRIYRQNLTVHSRPYDGVESMLSELASRGMRLAVLSNKPHDLTEQVVAELLPNAFEIVLGSREGMPRKPDPSSALEIAERLGLSPRSCAFIGDSLADHGAARSARMRSITVTWGFGERVDLEADGQDCFVDTPAELSKLLLEWRGS